MLNNTRSDGLLLINTVFASLGEGIEAAATPKGDPSPISSALEGPTARILSSRGALASLGAPSKTG